jgi:uncharacterized protein YydD (DUF2326 family)
MIYEITSSLPTFRTVAFKPGFNIVLADKTKTSTKDDSRNGVGKSTLIEIIQFCLGADIQKGDTLAHDQLKGVTFDLAFDLRGERVRVSRNTSARGHVTITAKSFDAWPYKPTELLDGRRLKVPEWNAVLGSRLFNAPTDSTRKYKPTFRSLISYFARRGKEAFNEPFYHHRTQQPWDVQVNNAFLLGLDWEDASDWQTLKDQKKLLDTLKKAAQSGLMKDVLGSVGELEAERITLEERVKAVAKELRSFKVHKQYRELEARADTITREHQRLSNANVIDRRLLEQYQQSIATEKAPDNEKVASIYASAGVTLPSLVTKRLAEVETFHSSVLVNRRQFLGSEIDKLERRISDRDIEITRIREERDSILGLLKSHGALDEFLRMQEAHARDQALLKDLEARLDNLRRFEHGRSALKIEFERLQQRARENYDSRKSERARAVQTFGQYSRALYKDEAGHLVIDISDSGFTFAIEKMRTRSTGIISMKIFCYDLMLASIHADDSAKPAFLIHDSQLFADVDGRQVAAALQLAHSEAQERSFQYICMFNSDKLPTTELSPEFDVEALTAIRLTDRDAAGSLLGMRF